MNFEEEEQKQKPVKKIEHDPDALEAYLNAEEPPKPVQPVQQPKVETPKPVTPPVEEPKAVEQPKAEEPKTVTPPLEKPKAEEPKPQTSTPPFETPKAETPQPPKPQLAVNHMGLKIAIASVVSLLIAGGGYYAYTHYYQKPVSKPVEAKKTEAVKPAPAPVVKATPPQTTTPPQVITPPVIETPKAQEQKVMVPPPPPPVVSAPSIDKPVKAEAPEHKTVDKPVKKSKPVHQDKQEKDAWDDRVNQVEQFLKDK